MPKKYLLWGVAACALTPVPSFAADPVTLEEVLSSAQIENPQQTVIDLEEEGDQPFVDGGDYLMSVPGVSGSRMGSHGIDPFIRGQKQSQLNIIDDGVFVHGGCPNRMDPPASYLSLEGNDEILVEKGYSSVQYGSGGSGGTIVTKKNAPDYDPEKSTRFKLSSGYDSNGMVRDVSGKLTVSFDEDTYLRANMEKKMANRYKDGNGNDVRSGFDSHSGRIDIGTTPRLGTDLTFGIQLEDTRDVLFAGAAMDAPESTLMSMRGSWKQDVDFGHFTTISASSYISQVDHIMDNYSLRPRTGMGMLTDSNTQIYGGKVMLEGDQILIGTDLKITNQNALRYMGAQTNIYASGNEQAYMWPGVSMDQIGLFAEKSYSVTNAGRFKLGLRYDYVGVDAAKVNTVSARTARSANNLYQLYYGKNWDNVSEHNVGGLIRYDHALSDDTNLFATLSRTVRTADITERAMAADHATASLRWIGNPDIDPEQHHQLEFGVSTQGDRWTLGGSVYYNRVADYILRDNATAQSGILLSDNADIYRNVDATLTGFELAGNWEVLNRVNLSATAAYTYGKNEDEDRPLAQIAPLEVTSTLEYMANDWGAGLRMRAAAKQNRADVGAVTSGQDTEKTGGYAVFDVFGTLAQFQPFDISLGVTNVLDKTYSNHLNRASSFDNEVTKVNEPGRSFFLRVNAEF